MRHSALEAGRVAEKALAFLEGKQNREGRMLDAKGRPSNKLASYYKLMWAFESAGRLNRANALADIIKSSFQGREGDFGDAEQRKGEEWFEWRYYTYPNIWIVIGAQKIGRFDISRPGTSFLLRYQDRKSGGFCNEAPYPKGAGLEDSLTTSASGLAVLYGGGISEASKAGDFLVRLMRAQQEIETRFYAGFDGKRGRPIEDFDDADAIFRVVETDVKEQYYFMLGLPIAFLSKLYLATSERRYLVAAKEYYSFTKRCTDYAYHYPASGKSGFGAAILSRITGDEAVADSARRQLGYYQETQSEDGSWSRFPGLKQYGDGATLPIEGQIDITAEFTAWINEMLQELR